MRVFRRFFSRWQNWVSSLLILGYVVVAGLAPLLSPHDPRQPGAFMQVGRVTEGSPLPPDEKAPLGMLPLGVDVLHALIWGSRDALQFGLIVTISTALFGILYGAISGFLGNRLGSLMIRVSDAFLAFPPIAGLVLLQQLFATTITAMIERRIKAAMDEERSALARLRESLAARAAIRPGIPGARRTRLARQP